MTYTAINRTIYFLLFLFCVGCTSTERKEVKEDLPSLPSVEFNSKKEISVRISECNFEKVEPRAVAIYESLIEQDGIRLLLGAKMSCDFKNGAFIKEIENKEKVLKVDLFQQGEKLSNECSCFFYFEVFVRNRRVVPTEIWVGKQKVLADFRTTISNTSLAKIKAGLKN
jgi:hypothetical protein